MQIGQRVIYKTGASWTDSKRQEHREQVTYELEVTAIRLPMITGKPIRVIESVDLCPKWRMPVSIIFHVDLLEDSSVNEG